MTGNHVLPIHIVGLVLRQGLIFIDGRRKGGRTDKIQMEGRKQGSSICVRSELLSNFSDDEFNSSAW